MNESEKVWVAEWLSVSVIDPHSARALGIFDHVEGDYGNSLTDDNGSNHYILNKLASAISTSFVCPNGKEESI